MELKIRARLARGLLNVLKDDVDVIQLDVDNYDLISLETSIHETRETLQKIADNLKELEYVIYLSEQGKTRNLQRV